MEGHRTSSRNYSFEMNITNKKNLAKTTLQIPEGFPPTSKKNHSQLPLCKASK